MRSNPGDLPTIVGAFRPSTHPTSQNRSTDSPIDRTVGEKHWGEKILKLAEDDNPNASPNPTDNPKKAIDPFPKQRNRRGEALGQKILKLAEDDNPNASPNPTDNPQISIDGFPNRSGRSIAIVN